MLSRDDQAKRARRRLQPASVEALENRDLMTYSPLGYSLPDLTLNAYSARSASWGGPLGLQIDVQNIGASSIVEPTNLAPGSTSSADAPATSVTVYASTKPNLGGRVVTLGSIAIPATAQNSETDLTTSLTLPQRPNKFPANGSVFLTLVVNNNRSILEADFTNNVQNLTTAITVSDPLPELRAVALDIPTALQPGDVITPTIRVGNFGTANTASQGPITVYLVASLNKTYGPGDAVIGSYQISSLPGLSEIPTRSTLAGDENVTPPDNYNTTTLPPLQLPTTPGKYFIGVVVDPNDTIREQTPQSPAISLVTKVGPRVRGFNATTRIVDVPVGNVPVFPQLPSAIVNPITVTNPAPVTPIITNPVVTSPILDTGTVPGSITVVNDAVLGKSGKAARRK